MPPPLPWPAPVFQTFSDSHFPFAPLVVTTWKVTPGAIEWLQKETGYAAPAVIAKAPEKPKRSGPREI